MSSGHHAWPPEWHGIASDKHSGRDLGVTMYLARRKEYIIGLVVMVNSKDHVQSRALVVSCTPDTR